MTIVSEAEKGTVSSTRPSLAEKAYETIKRAIIRCDLEPGLQVSEAYLSDRFRLSRAAVRPALKRLYQEQLVRTISGQRYIIPPITLKDAFDLFDMRLLLEPSAARRAAGNVSAGQLKRLAELSGAQYQMGNPGSAEEFLRANTEFHVLVAQASGNALLAEVIASLLDREERLNHLSHMLHDRNEDAFCEHKELVRALASGDADRAEQVMADGIQSARAFVIDALMSSPSVQLTNVTKPLTLVS